MDDRIAVERGSVRRAAQEDVMLLGTHDRYAAEAEWIDRFQKRLDELRCTESGPGAISFGLKEYRASPQNSPEEAAEAFAGGCPSL